MEDTGDNCIPVPFVPFGTTFVVIGHQSVACIRTPLPCLALGPPCKFRNNCPLGPSDLLLVELCDVARL
jgi:hypothetical protein